ncbi:uncharacterized protein LOC126680329 isoform X2 [Mercurialis annua]|uniref:uncharacterized protein LOC126680329 isoform X2 n=1 Tax=Mercurialis annua TaxID=3986 RepID=UPI00215EFFD1|nr:uncharacterized protein LOC126680329 isoform X2 [Mercurialis annua]
MGKIVEKTNNYNTQKKKKGRLSLLHRQKQNQNTAKSALHSSHNYNSATPPPSLRRSTRHSPTTPPQTSSSSAESERREDEEEEEESEEDVELKNGKRRREKKLKLVVKLLPPKSEVDNDDDDDGNSEDNTVSDYRKREINSVADGSVTKKEDNESVSAANPTNNVQDSGSSTPLPDKKLLVLILDRLQKKDAYGVYSEPVDPEELPDYFEVIEQPMDFGTVRKKLSSGAYGNLEQFEKDVHLISSNAMQYNAPDTIYFRQARTIQELAKRNFENLRQNRDDNEPEPTVVRRGRPPTKNLKKPLGRPPLDRAGSEYSLDATLATGGESAIDLRKGHHVSDKYVFPDSSGRSHGPRNDERNDEGSMVKGNSVEFGKRQVVVDESRRNTYKLLSAGGREPSVLTTFDSERKQLMAVGLLTEYGYAWSLARFAAKVGTVAWQIASNRIERSLPPELKFGPGWVGENDIPPQRALLLSSNSPGLPSPSSPVNMGATSSIVESKEKLSLKPENNMTQNIKSERLAERAEALGGLNSHGGSNVVNSSASIRRRLSAQIRPGINGFNNIPSAQMIDRISKTSTNFVHPPTANTLTSEDIKLSEPSSGAQPNGRNEEMEVVRPFRPGSSPQPKSVSGLSPQQVLPDLNALSQSPGSPSVR